MNLQLRENEFIVKTLEEGWTARVELGLFNVKYGHHGILTNQRLLFLKKIGKEKEIIEYELPLGKMAEATLNKHQLGDSEPTIKLVLKDGKTINIRLNNISQQLLYSVGILGSPPLVGYYLIVEEFIKEWINVINLQIKAKETRLDINSTLVIKGDSS